MHLDVVQSLADIKQYLQSLQDALCTTLSAEDGKAPFFEDAWTYASGGGGCTRVLENGKVFEKAGVNFSYVEGATLPAAATAMRPHLAGCRFVATGISAVIHPMNPYVPTSHLNVRFFVAYHTQQPPTWWFGGGYDLTPYYGFVEDCVHWHQIAQQACAPFSPNYYATFKQWADQYFYIKHRNEQRGVGGLFFDDLNTPDFATCYAFMQSVGNSFLEAYLPIVQRRKTMVYTEQHRAFQLYRRGRYVEFNLVYDRGTLFGLQSGGRTESILMSLPPCVTWQYDWQPQTNSPEARLGRDYLVPHDWVNCKDEDRTKND